MEQVLYIGTCHFISLPILSTLSTTQGSKRVKEGGGQGLKLCKRCFKEFDEDENIDFSPARSLGDIFVSGASNIDVRDLCPECREDLGVMNLMGFRP
jgi:hypothetical protein